MKFSHKTRLRIITESRFQEAIGTFVVQYTGQNLIRKFWDKGGFMCEISLLSWYSVKWENGKLKIDLYYYREPDLHSHYQTELRDWAEIP